MKILPSGGLFSFRDRDKSYSVFHRLIVSSRKKEREECKLFLMDGLFLFYSFRKQRKNKKTLPLRLVYSLFLFFSKASEEIFFLSSKARRGEGLFRFHRFTSFFFENKEKNFPLRSVYRFFSKETRVKIFFLRFGWSFFFENKGKGILNLNWSFSLSFRRQTKIRNSVSVIYFLFSLRKRGKIKKFRFDWFIFFESRKKR